MFQYEALNKGANVSLLQLICTIKFVILLAILLLACVFFSLVYFFLSRNQGKLVVPLHEEALNVVFILESV